jgi:UDP-GlcNAc:undecaprenyl-phosphate GlcNAc-1-phosphate transferase
MPALLLSGLVAFLLSLLLTPGLRRLLVRAQAGRLTGGSLERPPGHRSPPSSDQRERPSEKWRATPRARAGGAPRLGGLAVLAAASLALALRAGLHWGTSGSARLPLLGQLAGPTLLVLLVGVVDDWVELSPAWKFAGQALAALWLAGLGIRVEAIFHHPLPAWLALTITVVWLVGCTNAFNLIDGMDGLATGLALLATGTVLAHAVLIGEPGLALVTGVLFGALAGFLWFNFPPASIYLGDAGSLSIGFLLGAFALVWANKATTLLGLLAPFFALAIPMLDTATAIARRSLSGQSWFASDERHIHHRLRRLGMSPRRAVLVLYAVAGVGAVVSLVLADVRQRHTFELVIVLFLVLLGVGVHFLGYSEFATAGRLLRRGATNPRHGVQTQLRLEHWADRIAQATSYEEIWDCLRQAGQELGFDGVRFDAGPAAAPRWSRREDWLAAAGGPGTASFSGWTCQFPLGDGAALGCVSFWRELRADHSAFTDDLAAALTSQLIPRLQTLNAAPLGRSARAGS